MSTILLAAAGIVGMATAMITMALEEAQVEEKKTIE